MDIDMSRPGSELFPEPQVARPYNSYQDVNVDQVVDDPLAGVTPEVAGQELSQKEMNFEALRNEVAKMKEEREYWRGQAEASSRQPSRLEAQDTSKEDAYAALDWEDSSHVRKAFDSIRQENSQLRTEIRDALSAIETKAQRQDWNSMVTQHVPQLTSKNPIFAEMIQKASNPYEAAYLLAELNSRASGAGLPPPQVNTNGNAQRAIVNAQKPQSLASVGGNSSLNAADYYANMSDEDFMKIAGRNLAGI